MRKMATHFAELSEDDRCFAYLKKGAETEKRLYK